MSHLSRRHLTNRLQDVRLVSLASWWQANEIIPPNADGLYRVTQEGYDPEVMKVMADQFL